MKQKQEQMKQVNVLLTFEEIETIKRMTLARTAGGAAGIVIRSVIRGRR